MQSGFYEAGEIWVFPSQLQFLGLSRGAVDWRPSAMGIVLIVLQMSSLLLSGMLIINPMNVFVMMILALQY